MKKCFRLLVPSLIVGVVVLLVLLRSHPVLLKIPTTDDSINPRYYCIVNPFRDKGPETIAETHLNRLSAGQVETVSCCVGERKYVLEKEKQFPIRSWRLGDRRDDQNGSQLVYWVKRGNGYPAANGYEAEVHFTVIHVGASWQVRSFSAVY